MFAVHLHRSQTQQRFVTASAVLCMAIGCGFVKFALQPWLTTNYDWRLVMLAAASRLVEVFVFTAE